MTVTNEYLISDALRAAGWMQVDADDLYAREKFLPSLERTYAFIPGLECTYVPSLHAGKGYPGLVHPDRVEVVRVICGPDGGAV